jgi:hypothetical protein
VALTSIIGDPDNHGGQAGPYDAAYLIFIVPSIAAGLLSPAPARPVGADRRTRVALVAMAALIVPPAGLLAVGQALAQRNSWPPVSDPHHNSHWYLMGLAALIVLALAMAAAVGRPGWQIPGLAGSLAAAGLGSALLVSPDLPSTPPAVWGSVGLAWGIVQMAVLIAGTARARRTPSSLA